MNVVMIPRNSPLTFRKNHESARLSSDCGVIAESCVGWLEHYRLSRGLVPRYDMEKFWHQIHTVVAMLLMEDWYETNALVRLGKGTVIALDLGVASLALVVLLGMAILAATKTEEVATPAPILCLAK